MAKSARAGKIIARHRKAPAKVRARRPMVIDMHSHIVVPEIGPILKRLPAHDGPGRRQWISGSSAGEQNRMVNANLPRQTDLKVRFKEMDQMGIDIQVISYNIPTKGYYADGATGLEIARICNDTIAEFVSRAPDRFVGMGSVPLQDVRRATKELERAVTGLGLRGAWISSHVRAKDLGEKRLWPFWAKAQELDVPIFIHPQGFTHPERLQNAMLWSTIGQPLEEALAMASFIYDGDAGQRCHHQYHRSGGRRGDAGLHRWLVGERRTDFAQQLARTCQFYTWRPGGCRQSGGNSDRASR